MDMTIRRWLDLEDIETFFSKQIVKRVVFIQKIIHIQKVIPAHMANVLGCHSFRWIFYVFFAQFLDIWFHGKCPPLRGLYNNDPMRRNVFHEIWTSLSRIFLREERACGCNRVPGAPFCGYIQDNIEGHIRRKEKWWFSIAYSCSIFYVSLSR